MNIALMLKKQTEQRGQKVAAAQSITNPALEEKRDFTEDEMTKLGQIQKEIEDCDAQIQIAVRQLAIESQQAPKLSPSEQRDIGRFDYQKLLNHMHRHASGSPSTLDGIEAELISEGTKEAREAGIKTSGFVLPRIFVRRGAEQRDMTATGTTSTTLDQGGMTIATQKSGLLDDFYNASVLRQAGATVLEGLVGNLDLPRFVAGTAGAKKAENVASDEVTPTTLMLSLSPERLPSYVDISERLLMQSSAAIETIIRRNLTSQMLATQEAAFFHGGGTSEANGIAGTSGIGSVAGGTNGLAPALSHLVGLETAVDTQNALLGNLHYISNGQIRGKLKQTPKVASTDSRMLLDDNGLINGYSPFFTNAVSRALTKGSSSGVCSAIFFGNFADYYIGYWGGVNLEMVRDKTNAISGLYTLVASAYYDGGVVRPKSFAAMLDALGA
jgi:HK97 family phage major capsid protein